jgi:tetratricopeptide (TPR) repeat protein
MDPGSPQSLELVDEKEWPLNQYQFDALLRKIPPIRPSINIWRYYVATAALILGMLLGLFRAQAEEKSVQALCQFDLQYKQHADQIIAACTEYLKGPIDATDRANTYASRASAFDAKQDYARAIADLDVALASPGRMSRGSIAAVYNFRGMVHFRAGNIDRAIEDLSQAIIYDETPSYRHYQDRGRVYLAKKDYARSISDLTEAIRIQPKDDFSFFLRGLAYWDSEIEKAIADFSAALAISPEFNAYMARGDLYFRKGEFALAARDYSAAVALEPDNQTAKNKRAAALALAPNSTQSSQAAPPQSKHTGEISSIAMSSDGSLVFREYG